MKTLSNPEARITTLTSSSELTFSNTSEYSRQTLKELDPIGWESRRHVALSPLVECVQRRSVHLNEIHMGNRNRNLEGFSAEMRHGGSLTEGKPEPEAEALMPGSRG